MIGLGSRKSAAVSARATALARAARVKPAAFTFRELHAWHKTHIARLVERNGAISLTAIDHRNNRVVIGVSHRSAMPAVRELIATLPVPRKAVEVIVVGDIRSTSDTTLVDELRPVVPGGVQIARSVTDGCTLGFNVVRWLTQTTLDTARYFFTAGHCSNGEGQTESTYFGQSEYYDNGGTEVLEAAAFNSNSNSACPVNRTRYHVDANVVRYQSASMAEHGYVAATPLASITINGRYLIDDVVAPTTGYTVNMIGSKTGRRSGQVEFPCANVHYPNGPKTVLCAAVATYYSEDGDSGGPVIEPHGSGTAWAVGIHFARGKVAPQTWYWIAQNFSFFSPMYRVQAAMYDANGWVLDPTTASASPSPSSISYTYQDYANISGTDIMGPDMTCHWYGGTNIDSPTYEWMVNGTYAGSNADLYFAAPSSPVPNTLIVRLNVWNSSGAFATITREVAVASGTPQCYDQ